MNRWTLAIRSLRYYWAAQVGVVVGLAVAVGILTGALVVGDSVRGTLMKMGRQRLGTVRHALVVTDGTFAADLAGRVASEANAPAAAVLMARGTAARPDERRRANGVQVLGVDERFWQLGGSAESGSPEPARPDGQGVWINRRLARLLDVGAGDRVTIRLGSAGGAPGPTAYATDRIVRMNVPVAGVVGEEAMGRFSLTASQQAPASVFMGLDRLGKEMDLPGRANTLLLGERPAGRGPSAAQAERAVQAAWRLDDAELEVRRDRQLGLLELRSRRVFLSEPVTAAARSLGLPAVGVSTYFVTRFRHGGASTPYSLIAGLGALTEGGRALLPAWARGLGPGEVVVNEWLADDLAAEPGEAIGMQWLRVDEQDRLVDANAQLEVAAVVPISGWAADANLLPSIPGLTDVDHPRQWDVGIEIDSSRIRPKDDEYWQAHRGTPKAFVSLAEARTMWASRYGALTAVRVAAGATTAEAFARRLREGLSAGDVGLVFHDVRSASRSAAAEALDFGGLFLGFSFFLVASALLLGGLLFAFAAQRRAEELGLLRAVGWTAGQARRALLGEALLLAVPACVLGAAGGALYAWGMIAGLNTWWRGAVQTNELELFVQPLSLVIGGAAGLAAAMGAMGWVVWRQGRCDAARLLSASSPGRAAGPSGRARWLAATAGLCLLAAGALLVALGGQGQAGVFFGAGALLLTAGVLFVVAVLRGLSGRGSDRPLGLLTLATRNAARRAGRSATVAGMLAAGVFLLVSVGAFRSDPTRQAGRRDSGTGGFGWLVRTSVGLHRPLLADQTRRKYPRLEELPARTRAVSFRANRGEDASCLNLNRVQRVRLLGVRPEALARRGAFAFVEQTAAGPRGWAALSADLGPDVVPAVGDVPTVVWGLGKGLGEEMEYVDARGRPFRIRIVGLIGSSVLQGQLILSEADFVERFGSGDGYSVFLVETPPGGRADIGDTLSAALAEAGADVRPAVAQLIAFSRVENTYISIFEALGGLGLVLGTVAVGVVVARNVLDRRGELAALAAVGFSRRRLRLLIVCEHAGLLLAGVLLGTLAGGLAVWPSVSSPGTEVPYGLLAAVIAGILAGGGLWIAFAAGLAVRGPAADALRRE